MGVAGTIVVTSETTEDTVTMIEVTLWIVDATINEEEVVTTTNAKTNERVRITNAIEPNLTTTKKRKESSKCPKRKRRRKTRRNEDQVLRMRVLRVIDLFLPLVRKRR